MKLQWNKLSAFHHYQCKNQYVADRTEVKSFTSLKTWSRSVWRDAYWNMPTFVLQFSEPALQFQFFVKTDRGLRNDKIIREQIHCVVMNLREAHHHNGPSNYNEMQGMDWSSWLLSDHQLEYLPLMTEQVCTWTRDSASVSHSMTLFSFLSWQWLAWLQEHISHICSPPLKGNSFLTIAVRRERRSCEAEWHMGKASPHLVDEGNGLACLAVLLWGQLHVCFDDISRLRCQRGQDSCKDPTAKIQQGHEHWIQLICNRAKRMHSDTKQARNTHAVWQSEKLPND